VAIGIVIPAYNAGTTIEQVIGELEKHGFKQKNIIVVDDGSTDATGTAALRMGVRVIRHEKNRGKGAALKSGFSAARHQGLAHVITMDADGQHLCEDIQQLYIFGKDYDLVVGYRNHADMMPVMRKLVNHTTSLVISLLADVHVPDVQCGFRYIDLRLLDRVTLETDHYQTESEMIFKALRMGYRVGFFPVRTVYGCETSHIRPLIDTVRFVRMAIGFLWR
jgi:glycosyltransferase involved in cell wall biosynthesis